VTVREYLNVFLRRKWVILITFAVVMLVAVLGTLLSTPKYRASTVLRVLAISGGTGSDWVTYDTKQIDRLMNTYAEFATSRPVLQELVERLQLNEWPVIEVETLTDTELMQITAEAPDPVVARDAANALTEILIAQSRALYGGTGKTAQEILAEQLAQVKSELDQAWVDYEAVVTDSPEDTERISAASRTIELKETTYGELLDQYERNRVREAVLANSLSVVEPAVTPREPSKPRKELNLALGFVVGLAGGVALAFLIENIDTTVYGIEQIKRLTGLPILGKVPAAGKQEQHSLFDGGSIQGEAFRRLRTNLFTLDHDSPLRTLLVTSSEPKEGKSTIVANLAFSIGQSGRKVIVVDAHLRLPTVHRIFELTNRVGLSSVLEDKATLEEAVQHSKIPGVDVLTSGPLPSNPAELLSSPRMAQLAEQLATQYDLALFDCPSLLAVTDAAALSQNVNGVILVVERARARQERVRAARQELSDVNATPIGVVVNRSQEDSVFDYYQRMPA
jgi:non-specific protein-tyrosine kinase